MLIPTEDILKALTNLNNTNAKDWELFKSWVSESFMTQTGMLIDLDDAHQTTIFTGRCRELKEMWHYLENARAILEQKPVDQPFENPALTVTEQEYLAMVD